MDKLPPFKPYFIEPYLKWEIQGIKFPLANCFPIAPNNFKVYLITNIIAVFMPNEHSKGIRDDNVKDYSS